MARFIVLDIVFKASSLNYDLGGPTYHELKKLRKWNGAVHTFVSRYALRYSILETGEKMGLWRLAPAEKLRRAKPREGGERKGPIQPDSSLLENGEILEYPEFDLFGYMITDPVTNIRESPVKISHAISMTPYYFDKHFSANIGLARRMVAKEGEMSPNPLHIEEHEAFYVYSVVIDVDRIGKIDCILIKEPKLDPNKFEIIKLQEIGERSRRKLYLVTYGFKDSKVIKERIKNLVRVLLKLKRNIKGRAEDLSPILLVIGVYKDTIYDTYKDRIELVHFEREYVEEIEEKEENGKLIRIVRRKSTLSDKPEFIIYGLDTEPEELDEEKIIEFISNFLDGKEKDKAVKVYYRPGIKISLGRS
ncbi:MAG: type I-B CRISPR-associated protein Cas7/Cst2/DevR [Candidatus Njordarchaeales archaeon]